jgi:hypothetical protein
VIVFVQVIQGRVADRDRARAQLEKWRAELAPDSVGWLGTTAGFTDDDELVVLARFESEQAAQQNSARPEQDTWWQETAEIFQGEPSLADSRFVEVDTVGDPGQAGFVQVMQGQVSDPDRARALMTDDSVDMSSIRPDVLGSVLVGHDDGRWTMAIYFTSEAEAREAEQREQPPEMDANMRELDDLSLGEVTYLDLREPWFQAPN